MRTSTLAILLACLISVSLASATELPNWNAAAPQAVPAKSSPVTATAEPATAPATQPAAGAPGPDQMQEMMVALPAMLVPALEQFSTQLLGAAEASIPQLDVKHAERGISKLVASLSYLNILPFDQYMGAKGMALDKIAFGLEGIKQGIAQFAASQHDPKGAMNDQQKSIGASVERISKVFDLLIGKIAQIKSDSVDHDNALKKKLSQDGRRLKTIKQSMN